MAERRPRHEEIRTYLEQGTVRVRLREQLEAIERKRSTTASEITSLVGITEAQLRYWERETLLQRRPLGQAHGDQQSAKGVSSTKTGSQERRRIGYEDIQQLLVIKDLLDKGFTLANIRALLSDDDTALASPFASADAYQDVVESTSYLTEHLTNFERGLFVNYYVARALYLCACMLLDQAVTVDVSIFLPLDPSVRAAALNQHMTDQSMYGKPHYGHPADLPRLGKVLIGSHLENHPFYSFIATGQALEFPTKYRAIALDALDPLVGTSLFTGAYLVVERLKDLPHEAAHLAPSRIHSLRRARQVVRRILRQLQLAFEDDGWEQLMQLGGAHSVYESSSFANPQVGDRLLNGLADVVVELGKLSEKAALHQTDGRQYWNFCTVLVPDSTAYPIPLRHLVVRGQSKQSPYRIGKDLQPGLQSGMSMQAYQSSQVLALQFVADGDPLVLGQELEQAESAIALPLDGDSGGAMYVSAGVPAAFSLEDILTLRIMGCIAADIVGTNLTLELVTEKLSQQIAEPAVVANHFREFNTMSALVQDTEEIIRSAVLDQFYNSKDTVGDTVRGILGELSQDAAQEIMREARPGRSVERIALLAAELTDIAGYATQFGDEAARNFVYAAGVRTRDWLRSLPRPADEPRLYRVRADRYYILLKGIGRVEAQTYAMHLWHILGAEFPYPVEIRSRPIDQPATSKSKLIDPEKRWARIAVSTHSYEDLANEAVRQIENKAQSGGVATAMTTERGDADRSSPEFILAKAVANVRSRLTGNVEAALNSGRGYQLKWGIGDAVIVQDEETGAFNPIRIEERSVVSTKMSEASPVSMVDLPSIQSAASLIEDDEGTSSAT